MDNRREGRKAIELDIELRQGDEPIGRYRTSNLSHCGLHVAAEGLPLRRHGLVEATLFTHRQAYRIAAVVVHQSEQGVGLARVDFNREFARYLEEEHGLGGAEYVTDWELAVPGRRS